jgi:hypothetical protein
VSIRGIDSSCGDGLPAHSTLPLRPYVQALWANILESSAQGPTFVRIVPDGCFDLIADLANPD